MGETLPSNHPLFNEYTKAMQILFRRFKQSTHNPQGMSPIGRALHHSQLRLWCDGVTCVLSSSILTIYLPILSCSSIYYLFFFIIELTVWYFSYSAHASIAESHSNRSLLPLTYGICNCNFILNIFYFVASIIGNKYLNTSGRNPGEQNKTSWIKWRLAK